ncbi:MAG: hypothetical protein F4X75_24490 [Gemmatimonadetes bacterium]|nr:hypothetical protein [Gemmatimonadota bacterium]
MWMAMAALLLLGNIAHGKSEPLERFQDWELWVDVDPMGERKPEYFIEVMTPIKTSEGKPIQKSPGRQETAQLMVECEELIHLYVKHDKQIYGNRWTEIRAIWISGEKNETHHISGGSPKYAGVLIKLRNRKKPTLMTLMRRWEEVMLEIAVDRRYVYLPFSLRGFTEASKALDAKCKSIQE